MFLFSKESTSQTLSTGLVGDYNFNGNTLDNSGFGNNAIVWGAVPIAGKAGIPNTAYDFDGTTNYMEVPDANSLDLDTAITIYVVFKAEGYYTGPCQNNTLITKWTTLNGGAGFAASFTDNVVDYNCNQIDTTKDIFLGSTSNNNWNQGLYDYHEYIQTNIWYCAAFTQSLDTQKIYLNGVLKSSHYVASTIGINALPMWIAKGSNGIPSFKGSIDELKIYNRVLNSNEIISLCNTTTTGLPLNQLTSSEKVIVSPNPTSGRFTIRLLDKEFFNEGFKIDIVDMLGKNIYSNSYAFINNTINEEIELILNNKKGIYILKIYNSKHKIFSKIILN